MAEFVVRAARAGDARAMAEVFAAVAQERDGIATEPPVDIGQRAAQFARGADASVVAVAGCRIVGMLHVEISRFGFGDLAMLVDRGWRGRGVGSALLGAGIEWARDRGLHKLCLEVFARNTAAIALYRKSGFAEEGRRVRQYRRASGELWDSIVMGLLLLTLCLPLAPGALVRHRLPSSLRLFPPSVTTNRHKSDAELVAMGEKW